MSDEQTVFIVDDDAAVRESLALLLESSGFTIAQYESGNAFLEALSADSTGCLIIDVRMPGLSGLEVQQRLVDRNATLPVIIMTGHGDLPMAVNAMKAGAVDFLTKPFRDQEMLDAVVRALERDQNRRESEKGIVEIRVRLESLTAREREVMGFVVDGLMNKQIAPKLGVTEITVKVHRVNMMRKMKARSVVDLVGMADSLGIRRQKIG